MKRVFLPVLALVFSVTSLVIAVAVGRPQEPQHHDNMPRIHDQDANKQLPPQRMYSRGRVASKELHLRHEAAFSRHNGRMGDLPKVTAQSWDCRTLGIVPPIKDQGGCGSCWDFSGTGVVESALIKAGYGKDDGTFGLSEQYTLDCGRNGGCNGDDNTTVLAWSKQTGLPLSQAYGAYTARSGRCGFNSSMKLYRIADWGFCTPNQQDGIASTQDIKNAMVQYGPIGCAVAADSSWDNYRGGIYRPSYSRNIDHDVILVGWQDDTSVKEGGYWIMRNSWGKGWGEVGYMKIPYGANQIGTEAVWATANPLPPPPPVPPVPPVPPPVPPVPPTPPPPMPGTAHIYLPQTMPAGVYELKPSPMKQHP